MGLTPTRHDNSARIKPREDGRDRVATREDDFMTVAKDRKKHSDQTKESFNLMLEGNMCCFLGCDFRRKKNGLLETSTKMSIRKASAKVEQAIGDAPLASAPGINNERPEEDNSAPLSTLGSHHCQMAT